MNTVSSKLPISSSSFAVKLLNRLHCTGMSFLTVLLLFLLLPNSTTAQFGDSFELSQSSNRSVVSGGLTLFNYRHPNALSNQPYLFDNSLYTFRLSSGNQSGITFRYGTDEVSFYNGATADVTLINVSTELGGRKALYRGYGNSETMIYIPIRVFADYYNINNDATSGELESPVLNQVMITGGLGLGFSYRTPRRSLLSNRIFIDAYATRSLGSNSQIEDDVFHGAARQDNIKLQLSFLDLFGKFNVALGYEFRNTVFIQEDFHSFTSMLFEKSGYDSEFYSHTITLGISGSR